MSDESETDLRIKVAVLMDRQEAQDRKINAQEVEIEVLRSQVAQITKMADRWKGGFIVIVALGSFAGWLLSVWDKVTGKWHG